MKTEKVRLSQVKVNQDNPRSITERKLNLLVERLLVFPKMISIRPVVVDDKMVVLGGNMRVHALEQIAKMSYTQIAEIIGRTKNYQRLTQPEKEQLLESWKKWLEKPTVEIVKASELSEAEKKEFIIADNASFGEWDYDKLANEWEAEDLNSWGVDVWQPDPPMKSGGSGTGNASELEKHESDEPQPQFDPTNLPPELQGQDLDPNNLPKIEGNNEVAMERIIIVYPKDRAAEIAQLVGLEAIDKVVYNIDELIPAIKVEEDEL